MNGGIMPFYCLEGGERGEFTRKLTAMTVMPAVNEGD